MKRLLKLALPAMFAIGLVVAAAPRTAEAGHRSSRCYRGGYRSVYRYSDPFHFYSRRSRIHVGPHSAPHNGPHFHWNHGYHWGPHWQRHSNLHGSYGHSYYGL